VNIAWRPQPLLEAKRARLAALPWGCRNVSVSESDISRAIVPVILCGGEGTRLWPRSRSATPKPFLPLIGDETLLHQTLARCSGFGDPIIVTNSTHLPLVEKAVGKHGLREIVAEPEGKGTAAAVALAAARVPPDTVLLVCPSDHHFEDGAAFSAAARDAARLAQGGALVCLGVEAAGPDTGFGYIRRGDALGSAAFKIAQFVEKPDRDTAEGFIRSGEFAWNAGVFLFRAGDYLAELERFRPEMAASSARSVAAGREDGSIFHPEATSFAEIRADSIDYAVMENSEGAALVMVECGWSDVGTWQALYRARPKDAAGNAVRGPTELVDCENLLIDSDGPTVHALGLKDLVIVVDGEDILVASAGSAAKIAKLARPRRD
jgi:mannose-1-phosphate guanylyltransferase/mannose-1-phosphate guanylyltransferase/mannose-6-phosphate isomerase